MGQPGLQSQRPSAISTKTKMAKATRPVATQGQSGGEVRCIGIQS